MAHKIRLDLFHQTLYTYILPADGLIVLTQKLIFTIILGWHCWDVELNPTLDSFLEDERIFRTAHIFWKKVEEFLGSVHEALAGSR